MNYKINYETKWRIIPGFNECYLLSNTGLIKDSNDVMINVKGKPGKRYVDLNGKVYMMYDLYKVTYPEFFNEMLSPVCFNDCKALMNRKDKGFGLNESIDRFYCSECKHENCMMYKG